jgi:hypothetical protein|tara:strand:+ start:3686 stop:3928 length:243 start_codon:yes stop_codon:yes gene_type:complete
MSDDLRERRARNLLQDELFVEALDTLEKDLTDTWTHTGVDDIEAREQCWLSLRLLERIRLHLTSIVETGEMAKKIQEYHI